MLKITVFFLMLASIRQTCATIDASDLGVPQTNHQNSFAAQIAEEEENVLNDEGQVSLDALDDEPAKDSASADVAQVRNLFANAKNSIQSQRQLASQNSTA